MSNTELILNRELVREQSSLGGNRTEPSPETICSGVFSFVWLEWGSDPADVSRLKSN